MKRIIVGLAIGVLSGGIGASAAAAQGSDYPALSWDEEVRLAMSAGPASVARDATIYAMGEAGFEEAIEGSNGWACLVVRSATLRGTLAPHCLNPEAVAGVLPAFQMEAKLQAQGMTGEDVTAALARAWSSKELPLPEGPAYAFMLSKGQRLGSNGGSFRPHFMLYKPYATNAEIGGDPSNMKLPFVGPYENHPLSTVVILMEDFVDPADVVIPNR